ncbi:hypothetical protein B879_03775 [Cecembia lonarensis LW9]|uniref:Uncharacterized protein n=1 Tax=Cecembia lonarensis (strain CCUG 58316 / KCTC 22772 / LW9) TaxID=1225176 RepID=K1KYN8_CECL9|nr:hypothetical protein B879_03775 [Cecembia lonarensis LW9]
MKSIKNTVNLISLIEGAGEKGLLAKLIYISGFNSKTGCYYPKGEIFIRIFPNNLKGGYKGNTLMIPLKTQSQLKQSFIDIRIGDLLFSTSQIVVLVAGKNYILNAKYGYLKLKAELMTCLK